MFSKNEIVKFLSKKIIKEFFIFGIIGTSALIFEVFLIFILFKIGIDPKFGRILSIPLAILLTWYLNRTFTFKNKSSQKVKQYVKYCFVIMFGVSINYAVYLYCLDFFKTIEFSYVIAICFGSLSSMFFNFGFSKFHVFKH